MKIELGMQEGIAIEIYWYLVEQRKISAFTSIFTITGSCFDSFALGDKSDAISFGQFVEGQPGIQPEQIPGWATYNPGYDLNQPLYKTTPVFDAVKAAYSSGRTGSQSVGSSGGIKETAVTARRHDKESWFCWRGRERFKQIVRIQWHSC